MGKTVLRDVPQPLKQWVFNEDLFEMRDGNVIVHRIADYGWLC